MCGVAVRSISPLPSSPSITIYVGPTHPGKEQAARAGLTVSLISEFAAGPRLAPFDPEDPGAQAASEPGSHQKPGDDLDMEGPARLVTSVNVVRPPVSCIHARLPSPEKSGAGKENRTPASTLEGPRSSIELFPRTF